MDIGRASVVVSTHGYRKWNPRQRNLELWHGFPLKGMHLMDATAVREGDGSGGLAGADVVASYSALYSSLMNACMGLDTSRYAATGMPRNDLLWDPRGEELLDEVLGAATGPRKVVFYLPTYRKTITGRVDGAKGKGNLFGFAAFDPERFSAFLKDRGIRFIAKLHPIEERVFKKEGGAVAGGGIELLTEDALREKRTDLYSLLARADCLVTDYSSVYFDLLLRDVPAVFAPIDLEEYRANRGLLLEPYDFWAPGPKATDQDALEAALIRSLRDRSYYAAERRVVRDIVHAHRDDGSSARVWAAVTELAERRSSRGRGKRR
jgi:CDP-ribitol ribitolphosphotransferase / teichoic acid ribitol-phosphate polymerase